MGLRVRARGLGVGLVLFGVVRESLLLDEEHHPPEELLLNRGEHLGLGLGLGVRSGLGLGLGPGLGLGAGAGAGVGVRVGGPSSNSSTPAATWRAPRSAPVPG